MLRPVSGGTGTDEQTAPKPLPTPAPRPARAKQAGTGTKTGGVKKPAAAKAPRATGTASGVGKQTLQSVQKKSPRRGIRLKIDDDLDGDES